MGALPDAPCSSSAAAVRWLRKTDNVGGNASANAGVRQRKEEGSASGRDPNFCNCRIWLNGQSPQVSAKPKPRNRRCERSGRSPECRRPSLFLLHHQKAHSLFPLQEKENGGFEAAGLPRHPRSNGKKVFPRGGAAKPAAFAAPSRARDGRTSSSPQGEPPLSPAGGTLPIYSALSASTGWSRDALAAG